jgi:rod shape-determining protein MreC
VKYVTSSTATVVLANDPTSVVGARVEGSNELALLYGRGNKPMELQLLNPQRPIKVNDRIVTFGSRTGKPYVPGVPIGAITSVRGTPGSLTRIASVNPYVDFSALDIVGVVVEPPRTNPRDAVLPAKPTPAPTVTVTVTATPGSSASSSSSAHSASKPTSGSSPNPSSSGR